MTGEVTWWDIPGGVALAKIISDVFVHRYGHRITKLENKQDKLEDNQLDFQTKDDAQTEKRELRDDIQALRIETNSNIQALRTEMGNQDTRVNAKLDTVIGALLNGPHRP